MCCRDVVAGLGAWHSGAIAAVQHAYIRVNSFPASAPFAHGARAYIPVNRFPASRQLSMGQAVLVFHAVGEQGIWTLGDEGMYTRGRGLSAYSHTMCTIRMLRKRRKVRDSAGDGAAPLFG
jgi:hypothetical protein